MAYHSPSSYLDYDRDHQLAKILAELATIRDELASLKRVLVAGGLR